MAIGSVQASGGLFILTDAKGVSQQVDLGTLMLMLNLDRTKNLDDQIAMQLDEIQKRNATLSQLTELMAVCRKRKEDGLDDGSPTDGLPVTLGGVTKPIQGPGSWAEAFGITWTDVICNRGDKAAPKDDIWNGKWDANIQAIKGKIDMLNNDSQMANIKLQNLLEKRNNAFEMTTKVMDTNNQSIQAIIRNL